MNGATLPMGNGFPARLVAPRRRGYEWVKWVVAAGADQVPAWFQPPFPLQ
jgi:DMSO/TMAO reductase YedYZ molybdopterin-dependent catalytic subunit